MAWSGRRFDSGLGRSIKESFGLKGELLGYQVPPPTIYKETDMVRSADVDFLSDLAGGPHHLACYEYDPPEGHDQTTTPTCSENCFPPQIRSEVQKIEDMEGQINALDADYVEFLAGNAT